MELASEPIAAARPSAALQGRSGRVAVFLGISAALGLIEPLLAIFLSEHKLISVPWFVPAVVAFYFGATVSISLLSFGRFLFRKEPYAFWVGAAFWTSSLFVLAYLVSLESPRVSAHAYFFYLSYLTLLSPAFYLLAKTDGPKLASWRPLIGRLAWLSLFCVALAWAVFLMADRLPPLSLGPRTTTLSQVMPYAFFALYLGGLLILWRAFKRTQDPMVGYVFAFLILCLWAFVGLMRSQEPYDFAWFSAYLFPTLGCLLFYLALLLEYLDLYRELDATVDHLRVTHHLNTLVSSSLSLEEICRQLSQQIRKLVAYDRLAVNLLQKDQKYLRVYSEESALAAPAVPEGLSPKEGTATGWVVDNKQPLICSDVAREERFTLTRGRYDTIGIRSFIILPLIAKGQVLGALNLGSLRINRYNWKDVDTLTPVAEILSIAAENANLYEESQRRAEIQRLLKEVMQDITSLELNSLLEKLTKKVREVLKADVSDVRLIVGGDWRSLGVSGTEPGRLQPGSTGARHGISRLVLRDRKPVAVADMMAEISSREPHASRHGFRGYLGAPLLSRHGDVIGVLRALTYQPRNFTEDEVDLLQQLAGGAAIALENSRLFEDVRQKSRDLEAINQRLDRLLREQSAMREIFSQINLLDLDQLLRQLTEQALDLLRVDHVRVLLLGDGAALQTVSALGKGVEGEHGRVRPLGRGRAGWVMENRKPLAIRDLTREPDFSRGDLIRRLGIKGYLGIPLISRRQKSIGVLVATTVTEREFSQEEIAVAQQFAAGAAIAIENAYLLEEAKQKSLHLEALIKVNRDVASLLKRDFLLPRIANEARKFLNVDGASFRLVEGDFLVRAGYAGEQDLLALTPAMPLGESITGKIVRENRVIAVRNVADDAMIVEKHRKILSRSGCRSFLGVPLRLGRRVIGTINLYSKQEREFRPEEINLITAFADQTAIALENARLFEEVQKKSAELEDAFRTKTDFLNTMAHELRTPLNVVIGTQQLLIEGSYGGLTSEQSRALERIGRYAEDLLDLINEILDLVRLDARKVPVRTAEFSVREITDDLELSFAPLAREKGLELRFAIGDGMPRLTSDRSKIREILENLLANAVKYTERGEVELRVSLQAAGGNGQGRLISWSVRDTGIGIGHSDMPHLFEPFYMADGVDRRKYPGTGLGLSIVKRLVELLDGEIKIESKVGEGSTFTVAFPVAARAEPNPRG
ncbi:MAG TPA: GAF domain-containing protein [Candidatus Binatia bacterium]